MHPDPLAFVVRSGYPDARVTQQANDELMSNFIEGNLEIAQQLNSNWIFRVPDPPSLPLRPVSPNRTQFAGVGLFAGLPAGLAIVVRSRRGTTVGHRRESQT